MILRCFVDSTLHCVLRTSCRVPLCLELVTLSGRACCIVMLHVWLHDSSTARRPLSTSGIRCSDGRQRCSSALGIRPRCDASALRAQIHCAVYARRAGERAQAADDSYVGAAGGRRHALSRSAHCAPVSAIAAPHHGRDAVRARFSAAVLSRFA